MKAILDKSKFQYIKQGNNRYTIYFDCSELPICDEDGNIVETKIVCESYTFTKCPSLPEITSVINEYFNNKVSDKLVNGLVWNNMNICLSAENQLNYKSACDLAFQTDGANLPVTFKFKNSGKNVYYTFTNKEELTAFWLTAAKHINACLVECWKNKESVNYDNYKL